MLFFVQRLARVRGAFSTTPMTPIHPPIQAGMDLPAMGSSEVREKQSVGQNLTALRAECLLERWGNRSGDFLERRGVSNSAKYIVLD